MTTEAPDTPGSRLRSARERLGLQQIELGRKLGVSGSYISRIERDLVKIQPMVLRRRSKPGCRLRNPWVELVETRFRRVSA